MNQTELDSLIALGEGLTIEFKESASHLGREICGMANVQGGYILIGVDDNGRKVGITGSNRIKSQVQSAARNLEPALTVDIETVNNIIVITVHSGPDKPNSSAGHFYLRDAATTQRMSRGELREFFIKEGLIRWDEQPCREFSMTRDFDIRKYRRFVQAAELPTGLKREVVLHNLHLLTDNGITNAGVILFAKDVQKFCLSASMTCVLFQGKTKTKILDQATYHGNIVENYNDGVSYLLSHLNTEYVIKAGPRKEILELPEEAIREALINALVHRDYRSTGYVQVYIFHDRVEIVNPGGLVSGLALKDLGKTSLPRNALLFSILHRMDLVEHIGSGIKRIRSTIRDYGLKPARIETTESWFSILLNRKPQQKAIAGAKSRVPVQNSGSEKSSEKGSEKSSEKIIRILGRNPTISAVEIAEEVGISSRAVEKHIARLKSARRLERVGPDKGGFWVVKETPENAIQKN